MLEVGPFGLHLVDDEAGGGDGLADLLGARAGGDDLVRFTQLRGDAPGCQHLVQRRRLRGAHTDDRRLRAGDVGKAALGDQPAVPNYHDATILFPS